MLLFLLLLCLTGASGTVVEPPPCPVIPELDGCRCAEGWEGPFCTDQVHVE